MMVLDGAALDLALHGAATDPRAYLVRFGYDPPPLDQVDDGARPLDAEVNHGTWIWRCPDPHPVDDDVGAADIPATEWTTVGGGVVFLAQLVGWCPRCRNAATNGRWRPLRVPDEREAIERVLSLRADPETRNCWPGETVEDLERENAEHGVGV